MSGLPCANPAKKDKPKMIDLRSDTVTLPTPEMRRAMAEAEVGDDVYGEDPTINKLEQRAAVVFAREAAIFVPTGSMGNGIAIKLHTKPGQEIICEARGHIFNYEMGMLSWFSGCVVRPVSAPNGILSWDLIASVIAPKIYYRAQTGLISLENTHNMAGGTCLTAEQIDDICDHAHAAGIPVHMDGARIFNASTALGTPVDRLTQRCDSVMFCLSKALGAPVGSMLVGSRKFIDEARTVRKALGGGMRQAGILAAAGLIALEDGPKHLKEDHENAHLLATGLAKIPGIKVDPATVQTNIIVVDVSGTGMTTAEMSKRLAERNVLCSGVNPQLMRFVTHRDVTRHDCECAIEAVDSLCGKTVAVNN